MTMNTFRTGLAVLALAGFSIHAALATEENDGFDSPIEWPVRGARPMLQVPAPVSHFQPTTFFTQFYDIPGVDISD